MSPPDCPSSCRVAIRNQSVLAGFQPVANEYARFYHGFNLRSICQWTHSIPHSFTEHASARDIATVRTVPFLRTPPCPDSASWWRAKLSTQMSSILAESASGSFDHATHQSHCSLGQSISSVITWRRSFQGGHRSYPSCISYCCGDLHHCWFSIAGHGHLCRARCAHPLCQLLDCIQPHLHFSRALWSVLHLLRRLLDSGLPVKTQPSCWLRLS